MLKWGYTWAQALGGGRREREGECRVRGFLTFSGKIGVIWQFSGV